MINYFHQFQLLFCGSFLNCFLTFHYLQQFAKNNIECFLLFFSFNVYVYNEKSTRNYFSRHLICTFLGFLISLAWAVLSMTRGGNAQLCGLKGRLIGTVFVSTWSLVIL